MEKVRASREDYSAGLGRGIFSIGEAASILQIHSRTARRWVNGYTYNTLRGQVNREGAVVSDRKHPSFISFAELVELKTVKSLINNGVQLKNVVNFAHAMAEKMGPLPLAQLERFQVCGREIIASGDSVYVSKDQIQMTFDFVEEFSKHLTFDVNHISSKWFPVEGGNLIVLDAERESGHPIIDNSRVRVESIVKLFRKTGSKSAVQDLYRITDEQFEAAHDVGLVFYPVA